MVAPGDEYIGKAREFINLLVENGIDVSEAYLFGSAARGESNEDSDIDLAVVSPSFEGLLFNDIKKISRYRRKVDLRLEIHPFALSDVRIAPPSFFVHIQRQGIRIH